MAFSDQAIFRHKRTKNFSVIDNGIFEQTNISWRARGILLYLLSKPDDWKVREQDIIKHGPCGRDAVRSAIKELKDAGYIQKVAIKDPKTGKISEWKTYVNDEPQNAHESRIESTFLKNQNLDNHPCGNPTLLNTDELSTEKLQRTETAATQLYTVAPLLYKETGKLSPPKVIPEECTVTDSSFFDLSGQGVQDSPLTQSDQVASLTDYATHPNDSSGQKAITLPEIEKVPQRSKRLNKRGAHRTKLQYDKHGWLQLPYGKLYKLPRWMATRIMQYELAFDYLDYELAGTAPDGSLVVEGKDGTMTLDTAFGGPHSGGRLPLQLLRDCATQDRGQSRTIDQEWYNEELQLQFEQCVNWCERMGPDALTVINERGLLSLFTEYAEGADNRRYEWDEVEG